MASEVEDIEEFVLHHYDFTTASDWEIFIARVEEIIHEWKLQHRNLLPQMTSQELLCANWDKQTEKLMFADVEFAMTRHFIKPVDEEEGAPSGVPEDEEKESGAVFNSLEEMMCIEHDFIPVVLSGEETRPHVLSRWYGLRDFITIAPTKGSISSESKIKTLQSSLCIALNNTNCEIPMFIRALEQWQKFYIGVCEGQGIRTEFEMIHLRRIPQQCKHLTGLLNLFKSKIGPGLPIDPVVVSARFTYLLRDWTSFAWSQEPPDLDLFQGEVGFQELGKLPFGAIFEPISSLKLYTVWPEVVETAVVDSESYTDFEPTQALKWYLSATKADSLVCLLSDYLNEFIAYCLISKSNEDLLGDFANKDSSVDFLEPFSLLTETHLPNLTDILSQYALPKKHSEGPIAMEHLVPIMCYLFPDPVKYPNQPPYPDETEKEVGCNQRMKTCTEGGLVWRLSLVMAHALHMLGGPKAAAHIWHEFTRVLRFYWNSSTIIPGVSPGFPDPKTCLLHQKIQMINCCIEAKVKREKAALTAQDSMDESEDEFFDCFETEGTVEGDEAKAKVKHGALNTPIGRMTKHSTLKLINSSQPLYIPLTQDPIPKTEDQLEEDAEILLHLGTDAEGSQLRARLMSASLLSDMESFKAANPGSAIEDFIRWYSPRDWIEENETDESGQKKGRLSARMLLPGNTWLEIWEAAKPIPARRQKRLFDDTREAEKALHFIQSRSPAASGQLLLPVLWHVAINQLSSEAEPLNITPLNQVIEHALKKAETLSRQPTVELRRYQELCLEVNYTEAGIAQVKSLEQKLCPEPDPTMRQFIAELLIQPEVQVPEGPIGPVAGRIKAMFKEAYKASQMLYDTDPVSSGQGEGWSPATNSVLPPPQEKEFILRSRAPRPSTLSKKLPHRLSVRISKNEIQMAGAFSQDTTFQ